MARILLTYVVPFLLPMAAYAAWVWYRAGYVAEHGGAAPRIERGPWPLLLFLGALCAFGVTAYELAACGVPAIYLGLTDDHARSATAFADAGMGISLGVASHVSDTDIAATVQWLLHKPGARREMRGCGLSLMDGQGAARIAADLSQALEQARMRAA